MTDMREAMARIVAPFLQGGREFDQMPKNHVQRREWAAMRMCDYNDASQGDALDLADAIQPEIERRVAKERAKLLERLLSLPPSIYDGPTRYISLEQLLAQFEEENSHEG